MTYCYYEPTYRLCPNLFVRYHNMMCHSDTHTAVDPFVLRKAIRHQTPSRYQCHASRSKIVKGPKPYPGALHLQLVKQSCNHLELWQIEICQLENDRPRHQVHLRYLDVLVYDTKHHDLSCRMLLQGQDKSCPH